MIQNGFTDVIFAEVAARVLELEFFSQDEILSASFRDHIEPGDFYLQYRRPGRDILPLRGEFSQEQMAKLPPFAQYMGYDSPLVGLRSNADNAQAAIRIFQVIEVDDLDVYEQNNRWWRRRRVRNVRGPFKVVKGRSWYSRPSNWAVSRFGNWRGEGGTYEGMSAFKDVKSRSYYWKDKNRYPDQTMYLKENNPSGIVARFDKNPLDYFDHETGRVEDRELYPLIRALLGDNNRSKRTRKAFARHAEELGIGGLQV
jgi:hypothetical protein